MSTNNAKRNAIGPRLLAGSVLGLTLVLMVVAGMHSRADSASVNIAGRAVEHDNAGRSNANTDVTAAYQRTGLPPSPPSPPQGPQPPQPAQLTDPDNASQPSQASQPNQPNLPASPNPPQAEQADQTDPTPPTPPASRKAPLPPPPPVPRPADDQDKSSDKPEKPAEQKRGNREVVKGELIEAPQPIYPDEAKEQKVEGTVTVGIVIDEEGKVISAKVVSGHQLLHGASRDAAFKARFKPTTVNGQPAKVSGAMTYNFVLDKK